MVIYGYKSLKEMFEKRVDKGLDLLATISAQIIIEKVEKGSVKNYFYTYNTKEITKHVKDSNKESISLSSFVDWINTAKNDILHETLDDINEKKAILVNENRIIATDKIKEVQLICK